MDSNRLTGSIPVEWMNLTALEALILVSYLWRSLVWHHYATFFLLESTLYAQHKNNLTGTLPTSIGKLTRLQDLWVNKNHLQGVIPTELSLLTDLVTLYVQDNPIEGLVPREIGNMHSLETIRLSGTKLGGVIPEEVCKLKTTSELAFISASCNTLRCFCCDKCV